MNQALYDRLKANPPSEWWAICDGAGNHQELFEIAGTIQHEAMALVFQTAYIEWRACGARHENAVDQANLTASVVAKAFGMSWQEITL